MLSENCLEKSKGCEATPLNVGQAGEIGCFILRRRKPRPLGVVRDKRLCLTKVLGLKALGHCLGTNSSKTGRAAVAAFIS